MRTGNTSSEVLHADTKDVAVTDFFNFWAPSVNFYRWQLFGIDRLRIILAQHVALLIRRKKFQLVHCARVLDYSPVLECLDYLVLAPLINVVSEIRTEELLYRLVIINHKTFGHLKLIIAQRQHQLLLR
jgi:hypothetical protein